ncbi:hypothetical protein Tco_1151263, partial [Tanacetum coccineum]
SGADVSAGLEKAAVEVTERGSAIADLGILEMLFARTVIEVFLKADDEKPNKPNVKAKKGEACCKSEEDEKTSPKKQKSKNKDEVEEKSKSKRPDLKSLSFLRVSGR